MQPEGFKQRQEDRRIYTQTDRKFEKKGRKKERKMLSPKQTHHKARNATDHAQVQLSPRH